MPRNLLPVSQVQIEATFEHYAERFLESRSRKGQAFSDRTKDTYSESLDQFRTFLRWKGMPLNPENIKREHIEAFLDTLERGDPSAPDDIPELAVFRTGEKAATVSNRYRCVRRWFNWLTNDEEAITDSPM